MTSPRTRYRIVQSAAAAAFLLLTASALARPAVERVSFSERADGHGFVIRFHLDGSVSAYTEPREVGVDRLEIVLFNTSLSRNYMPGEGEGPVRAYSGEPDGGHVVFRFELDSRRPITASAYRDRSSNDILLGLTFETDAGRPLATERSATPSIPVKSASLGRTTASEPHAANASKPASSEGQRWMLDTIVIDAGHGGRDPGAVAHGLREKDVTLAVAKKLGEYVRAHLGINVLFTREDDRFIELKDRGKFANANGGKLFVSIHVNSASNARAHGTETFFLGTHRSEAARNTMERENSVVQFESDPDQYKQMDEESLIRMELTQSAYMRKSEELSSLIEEQFADRVGRRSRGVKQAGFYVLWGASMPAVLVELGFLTNRSEAEFLRSESGQAYMASAIFRAIREYKLQYEKGLSLVSSD